MGACEMGCKYYVDLRNFYLECNIQRVRIMHSFQKKKVKMEIIAASMRETNLTYPNIFSETFKQSMYAK